MMPPALLPRLLPRSLLWRFFLLIATLMLLAVAAWLLIFRAAEVEPRARQLAQMLTSVTNLTRTALLTARPEQRHVLLDELSDSEGVHVYPAEANDIIEPPPSLPLTIRLETLLVERLGPETRLAFSLNGEQGLFVRFRIFAGEDGDFWLALPRERLERHFPLQWIGGGLAVLLLALAGAWLIVYRIVQPLEKERALLLAGISHDLRTPLTRLRLDVEMSVTDADVRAGMEADIIEMDHTIGQFLDFARPMEKMAPQHCDLAPLLREIVARYPTRATSADFLPAHAQARPELLRRALINLIENALRHAGTPVELTLENAGHDCIVSVLDRGPGIPASEIEQLKLPFTRGETARTGASGAGLGLAIVDRLVRSQGGRLELLPREGGGLVARIRLKRSS